MKEQCSKETEKKDIDNYKGVYFVYQPNKFFDKVTGAHFDYIDVCQRLEKLVLKQISLRSVLEVENKSTHPARVPLLKGITKTKQLAPKQHKEEPIELPPLDPYLPNSDHKAIVRLRTVLKKADEIAANRGKPLNRYEVPLKSKDSMLKSHRKAIGHRKNASFVVEGVGNSPQKSIECDKGFGDLRALSQLKRPRNHNLYASRVITIQQTQDSTEKDCNMPSINIVSYINAPVEVNIKQTLT